MEQVLTMPLARYFFFVGGVLLALLFVSDAYGPKLPAIASAQADAVGEKPALLRIRSDRKWPEAVVFDTRQPTIVPAPTVTAEAAVATPEISAKARVRESFAQLVPPDSRQVEPQPQHKRKVAKAHIGPPPVLMAQHPRYDFFANNTW